MQESKIEKILREEVKKLGGRAYKFVSPGNAGVPDRIILLPAGRIVFCELKKETGRLSKLQSKQIGRILDLGFPVVVLHGEQAVLNFIEEVKTELKEAEDKHL